MVSVASLSPWAKSVINDRKEVVAWLPLWQHCDDSEAVAYFLVDNWISPQVNYLLAQEIPGGQENVRKLVGWLAATHDVGKASIAFAVKVDTLADRMDRFGLKFKAEAAKDKTRLSVPHALVSHIAVRDWLAEKAFPKRTLAKQLGSILGSHHGVSPDSTQIKEAIGRPQLLGQGPWQAARDELLERATERAAGLDFLRELPTGSLSLPAQVLLCAIVIVADWIASNAELFPLDSPATLEFQPTEPDDRETQRRASAATELLNLPRPWRPIQVGADLDAEFARRFPHVRKARPVQRCAVDTARKQRGSGLVIIEAPMGVGKTEAAYLAAEVLAGDSGAGGCVIALPTQATTDAMFSRTLNWLRTMPTTDGTGHRNVTLAHGKASLNDEYTGLLREGRFRSIGDSVDEGETVLAAHEWLRGRKKGMLASFVVCTIDQILTAALKSRHVMLRHLALAGKVVIIDEVHAYDVYMSQYLYRALHWLGAYGVPVILLSATLPATRRAELLAAYQSGSGEDTVTPETGYPLVTGSRTGSTVVPLDDHGVAVQLDRLPDDLPALINYLTEHLCAGGCAAVVRNTVARVQETADALALAFPKARVTIDHGRFLACDRARIDGDLVRRFGPPGPGNDRDGMRIVVASQVIEQSLDLDFDLLVTDLAPMDLLLQRLGRVHRHERDRPEPLRTPRCAVTGVVDFSAAPVRAIPNSRRIYDEHLLLRTVALLHDRDTITLPHDISPLVQSAYSDTPLGPESWQPMMRTAAERSTKDAAQRVANASVFLLDEATRQKESLVGWLRAGVGDADDPRGIAQVRDGAESLEVVVVQQDKHGELFTPAWITRGGGQQLPRHDELPYWLAKIVASCSLRLPYAMSHPGVFEKIIATLERNRFESFAHTPLLKGELVLVLDMNGQATVRIEQKNFHLTYDVRRGLLHDDD